MHIDRKSPNRQIILKCEREQSEQEREKKRWFLYSLLTLNQLFRLKWMSFVQIQCVHNSLQQATLMKWKTKSIFFYPSTAAHISFRQHFSREFIYWFSILLSSRSESKSIKIESKISSLIHHHVYEIEFTTHIYEESGL